MSVSDLVTDSESKCTGKPGTKRWRTIGDYLFKQPKVPQMTEFLISSITVTKYMQPLCGYHCYFQIHHIMTQTLGVQTASENPTYKVVSSNCCIDIKSRAY